MWRTGWRPRPRGVELPCDPAIPLLGAYPGSMRTCARKERACPRPFTATSSTWPRRGNGPSGRHQGTRGRIGPARINCSHERPRAVGLRLCDMSGTDTSTEVESGAVAAWGCGVTTTGAGLLRGAPETFRDQREVTLGSAGRTEKRGTVLFTRATCVVCVNGI